MTVMIRSSLAPEDLGETPNSVVPRVLKSGRDPARPIGPSRGAERFALGRIRQGSGGDISVDIGASKGPVGLVVVGR